MKFILTFLLAFTSVLAIAEKEENLEKKEIYSKDVEKDESAESIRERQEARLNDDFDPELDAVDDDLTKDEGLHDD